MREEGGTSRPETATRLRWAAAVVCAGGSAWLYKIVMRLAAKLPSAEPTAISEVLPWVRPVTHRSLQAMQRHATGFAHLYEYMACCVGLFILYGVMVWLMRGVKADRFFIFAAAASAAFRAILLSSPVMLSFDAYAYAFYGRLLAFYGANAHAAAPAASATDPFHAGGIYQWGPSWYGPLWTAISGAVAWFGAGHVGLTLLIFRCIGVAASLGIGGLLWAISSRLWPERSGLATILFLWNPLVVMESALAGHNDGVMIALALLAVWLHLRGWKAGAISALTLSALVKVIAAPLIPLYLLMVLRETAGWPARLTLLARATAGAAIAVALSMLTARMNPTALLAHTVASASFYKNNYHELIFRALRRELGESPSTLDAPMDFQPWWVATSAPTALHAGTSSKSPTLLRLKPSQPLMALSAIDSEKWLRVYDPADRAVGFVNWSRLYATAEPADAANDPNVRQLSIPPGDWPTVAKANRWIRLATWGLFALFGLVAAWRARDFAHFLAWTTLYFIAALLLVVTQIWPWYMIWPVAFGALRPAGAATQLALLMSAALAMSYALLGFCNTRLEWVFDYRSLFTIVIPVVAFALWRLIVTLPSSRRVSP